MFYRTPPDPRLDLHYALAEFIGAAAIDLARHAQKAFRVEPRRRPAKGGKTLRPGKDTPLWNALRVQLRPHLKKYGHQANLARLLGLPRQRVNSFVTGGGQMPDAERTLQLLAWLMMVRSGRRPS
jgi:hypothetical protein